MGYSNPDPYYQPEEFGLEIVGSIDDPNACYSFDLLVAWWRREDGALFYGVDSGCSCPSPFEDVHSVDELTPITLETQAEFDEAVDGHCARTDCVYDDEPTGDDWEHQEFEWRKTDGTMGKRSRWTRRLPDPGDFAADKHDLKRKVNALLHGEGV